MLSVGIEALNIAFMVETAANIREAIAATRAVTEVGKSCWTAFTLDDRKGPGLLRSGELLLDAAQRAIDVGAEAILLNCSMPETISDALPALFELPVPIGVYANGFKSIEALEAGGTVDSLTAREDLGPASYADWAMSCVEAGARIIGGCCETSPEHISVLRSRLEFAGYEIVSNI